MPMQSAVTADVYSVLMAGGASYAASLIGNGYDMAQVRDYLRRNYTPIGGSPYPRQVYEAVARRAASSLSSGAKYQRKRNNDPLADADLTGMVGLPSTYRYTVIVEMQDTLSGRQFSVPFYIDSSTAMGKWDILAHARGQAFARIESAQDTLGGASSMSLVLSGREYISQAQIRI